MYSVNVDVRVWWQEEYLYRVPQVRGQVGSKLRFHGLWQNTYRVRYRSINPLSFIFISLLHIDPAMPRVPTPQILCRFSSLRSTPKLNLSLKSSLPIARHTFAKKYYSTEHTQDKSSRWGSSYGVGEYCVIGTLLLTTIIAQYLHYTPLSNDAPSDGKLASANTKGARIEIRNPDQERDGNDQIATGTSTVPFFPRKIWLPRSGAIDDGKSGALPAGLGSVQSDEEYQLLGLGIRTVSFLSIEVYVVGFYVAKSDLGKLQEGMVRAIAAPGASTLVEGEKAELKRVLVDAAGSERIWGPILEQQGIKSAVRVVPTRGTAFGHLRDGWLRGITARGKSSQFDDPGFQDAVGDFKGIFAVRGGTGVPKGKALLLGRGGDGVLRVWMERERDDGVRSGTVKNAGTMATLGSVKDERIGRLVWLGYLAGANVASEGARKSVVDGVMDLVERPIGTVETQVI